MMQYFSGERLQNNFSKYLSLQFFKEHTYGKMVTLQNKYPQKYLHKNFICSLATMILWTFAALFCYKTDKKSDWRQITLRIVGYYISSQLTDTLNLCLIYFKITWALSTLLKHIHTKFEINRTKIKGSCQSGRKVVPHDSNSDLPLEANHS